MELVFQIFIYFLMLGTILTPCLTPEKIINYFQNKNWIPFFHFLHFVIIIPSELGFLLPKKYLPYHVLMIYIIFCHWQSNNHKCITTQIQNNLANDEYISYHHRIWKYLGIDISQDFNISLYQNLIPVIISSIRLKFI